MSNYLFVTLLPYNWECQISNRRRLDYSKWDTLTKIELLLVWCCLKVVLICGCDQNNEASCVLKLLEVCFMTFALCGCDFPELQIPQRYSQNRSSCSECINTGQTAESHGVMFNIFSLDTKHRFLAFFSSSCLIIVDGFVPPCCFVLSMLFSPVKILHNASTQSYKWKAFTLPNSSTNLFLPTSGIWERENN